MPRCLLVQVAVQGIALGMIPRRLFHALQRQQQHLVDLEAVDLVVGFFHPLLEVQAGIFTLEELFELSDFIQVLHHGALSAPLVTRQTKPEDIGRYMIGSEPVSGKHAS